MLVVVSPAKKLNMDALKNLAATKPMFPDQAQDLAKVASKLSTGELKKLMGISDNLANLNKDRFEKFGLQDRKQAAFAFAGDTYQGLEAASLNEDELSWAQDHLRILSGLYGLLRPLDEIEPYRLEMGSQLKTERGKSLYHYWGSDLALALNKEAQKTKSQALVNCASQEYFGAVDKNVLIPPIITPVFMENTDKGAKIVSFYAKKARGSMARFIVTKRLSDPQQILDFNTGGYTYQPEFSSPNKPLFLRG
tara:strand:- start:162 stop:914 length:753 start_codon:yes stop_codon:yes gene_type:complete